MAGRRTELCRRHRPDRADAGRVRVLSALRRARASLSLTANRADTWCAAVAAQLSRLCPSPGCIRLGSARRPAVSAGGFRRGDAGDRWHQLPRSRRRTGSAGKSASKGRCSRSGPPATAHDLLQVVEKAGSATPRAASPDPDDLATLQLQPGGNHGQVEGCAFAQSSRTPAAPHRSNSLPISRSRRRRATLTVAPISHVRRPPRCSRQLMRGGTVHMLNGTSIPRRLLATIAPGADQFHRCPRDRP
jgi:fatty-acyl-CoA synthase